MQIKGHEKHTLGYQVQAMLQQKGNAILLSWVVYEQRAQPIQNTDINNDERANGIFLISSFRIRFFPHEVPIKNINKTWQNK